MNLQAIDKAKLLAKAADERKALELLALDMRELTTSTDYFIVCTANTANHARGIADAVEEAMDEANIPFLHKEGYRNGEWILLDYGDCIVHIFTPDARDYYSLERLWADAPVVDVEI